MPKTRREFSPEFKRETVALLETSGRPLMQVATEVGIPRRCCGTDERQFAERVRDRGRRPHLGCRRCRRRRTRCRRSPG